MNFKDGYIALHSDLPRQLAYAPDQPLSTDEKGFFEAYHATGSLSVLKAEIEEDARTLFQESQDGDIDDDYACPDDVPRDGIARVRVYANGDAEFYDCPEYFDSKSGANIHPFESPVLTLTLAEIYRAYGENAPCTAGDSDEPNGPDF